MPDSQSRKRTDEYGRAYAGSQLQIQTYVNRYQDILNQVIARAINAESTDAAITWASPLEQKQFSEYRDAAFLRVLNLSEFRPLLSQFWPSRGARWDALGFIPNSPSQETHTVILVEAKSTPGEVFSFGCRATEKSRPLIERSLAQTRKWLHGSDAKADMWTGALYQYANRLAHLYFFREIAQIPAWLVNVYFIDDPRTPTTLAEWQYFTMDTKKMLGLPTPVPYAVDIFLPAHQRGAPLNELGDT